MSYILLIILLMNLSDSIEDTNRSSSVKIQRKKSFAALVFSTNNNLYSPNLTKRVSCDWLSRLKHQSKLCWRRRGLPEALISAKELAVHHCEEKFRYDQWNCSSKDKFFKKIYRETAFMYSITSSAIMYSIAKACAEGTLAGCKCGEHGKIENSSNWQWGGCGDNSKFAKRFTKKFLQLRKKGDNPHAIIKYNTELGIKIVLENEERACRCHGVSASCTVKVCWKKIRSFSIISEQLKNLYHNAIQVESNKIRNLPKGRGGRKLLYLENSPNFCPSTVNRRCKNADNCATLCCGRGFYTDNIQLVEKCNCSWRDRKTYSVQCEKCPKNETIFICK